MFSGSSDAVTAWHEGGDVSGPPISFHISAVMMLMSDAESTCSRTGTLFIRNSANFLPWLTVFTETTLVDFWLRAFFFALPDDGFPEKHAQ
jgi:hypothetical protein